ncbi:hypothetical protein C7B80_10170 [Cyanosarcina cf. burmensis CCALA 770]|nr:hypothetical protein C7B80_10170 [Cyanosarcina cf. burmensis CCALA 770]
MIEATPQEAIAAMQLVDAIEKFAIYLQELDPTMTKAENLTLRASIIFALPRLYEANPPLKESVTEMVKDMRRQA